MAETADAEPFFESLAEDFDINTPLRWSFLLDGLPEDRVGSLMTKVGEMGFTEMEPLPAVEPEGVYILGFAEVCVHSARSFVDRVALVEQFAAREGLVMADFSAGLPEE